MNLSDDMEIGHISTFPLEYDDDTLIGGSARMIDDSGAVDALKSL